MPTTEHATDRRSLTDAALLFRRWRAARQRGERIPAELWTAARDAARQHGVSQVSLELGLDYYGLKRRLEESAEPPTSPVVRAVEKSRPTAPGFIELPLRPTAAGNSCAIELEHARPGSTTKLRIELPALAPTDLVALINSWRAQL